MTTVQIKQFSTITIYTCWPKKHGANTTRVFDVISVTVLQCLEFQNKAKKS